MLSGLTHDEQSSAQERSTYDDNSEPTQVICDYPVPNNAVSTTAVDGVDLNRIFKYYAGPETLKQSHEFIFKVLPPVMELLVNSRHSSIKSLEKEGKTFL